MKYIILGFTTLFVFNCYSQVNTINKEEIREDLNEIINDILQNYVYLNEKNVSIECINYYYFSQIKNIQTEEDTVLFFEYLIDEFYDSHLN